MTFLTALYRFFSKPSSCVCVCVRACERAECAGTSRAQACCDAGNSTVIKKKKSSGGAGAILQLGSGTGFAQNDDRFFSINFQWSTLDVLNKNLEWSDTFCTTTDVSQVWFLGGEDGQPSYPQIFPDVATVEMYFADLPINVAVGSATRERAACRIQHAWRSAITDPRRAMCVARLKREFVEMTE